MAQVATDPWAPVPGQTNWQNFWSGLGGSASNGLGNLSLGNPVVDAALHFGMNIPKVLNAVPVPVPAAMPAASSDISFGMPTMAGPADQTAIIGKSLEGVLGSPIRITSTTRTPEHNAEVGGVPNSMHLSGQAMDFVPTKTTTKAAAAAAKASGMFSEVIDEGDHVHVGWGQKAGGNAAPLGLPLAGSTVTPGDLTSTGGMSYVDPKTAMGIVPNPIQIPSYNLPAVPTLAAPAPRPDMVGMDKAATMAPFEAALAVPVPETKDNGWEKVAAMLAAAATSAGQHPGAGLGTLIGAAGGAAGAAAIATGKEQKAEIDTYKANVRAAQLTLAKLGFDIDTSNLGVANQNKTIDWQSGEDTRTVKNQNIQNAFEQALQQAALNHQVTAQNIGAQNEANRTRASVGISALGGAAGAQNTATEHQITVNANTGLQGNIPKVNQILDSVGVPRTETPKELPTMQIARGAAAAVAANNVDGALAAMAQDLVASGNADIVLAPAKGDPPNVAKAKKTALQAIKLGSKASGPGAAATISTLLASDHSAALAVAKEAAKRGSYTAKMILQHNTGGQ